MSPEALELLRRIQGVDDCVKGFDRGNRPELLKAGLIKILEENLTRVGLTAAGWLALSSAPPPWRGHLPGIAAELRNVAAEALRQGERFDSGQLERLAKELEAI